MSALGFIPTKNSGSGWIEKEDGHNDFLIAQLKSTDAASISVKRRDIQILEYNAAVCHKVPCFVIQFLQTNDVFILARPEDLAQVAKYIETGSCDKTDGVVEIQDVKTKIRKKVKSCPDDRDSFWGEREKQWNKRSKQK